jgi:uncharacterized protein YfiM (DUF2279 family)
MIALLLALQMTAAPEVQADTEGVDAIQAIGAIDGASRPYSRFDRFHTINAPVAPAGDAWLGADKFKHAGMSYAITAFSFAATESEAAAIAGAGVAGILKEIYDRRRGSVFSLRDLVWDAAGIALGYAVVKQTR